ncbi:uncharacterized protein LOC134242579 isoform X2 [Saccostrea cucullata]|uniref:uncharacterized protein LOC134242579 isoform X2 n=1 Tax=Saccostrea cuccullata TaxID=36930 RepID=UPI002ED5B88F
MLSKSQKDSVEINICGITKECVDEKNINDFKSSLPDCGKKSEELPKVKLEENIVQDGERLRFTAHIFSKEDPKSLKWLKDGKELEYANDGKFERKDSYKKMSILYINNLGKEDEGEYTALVTTSIGAHVRESISFKLPEDAPEVKLELKIIEKEKKVRIFARGNPKELALNLKWFHNSHEIVFQNQTKYTETTGVNNVFILGVHDVNREDEGNFSVRMSNRSGKTTCKSVLFHITEDLPSVLLLFSKKEAEIVELIAEVRSTWPIEYFYWTKDGKSIPLDNSNCVYKFDSFKPNTYNLKIKNPRQEDEGEYKLVVESVAGRSESNGLFIRNFLGMKGMKGNLPCDLTENEKQNRSMLDNDNKKTDVQIHKSVESRLDGISRPYKTEVRCKICNKMATAIFQTCGHSFCLECLQRAVGSVDFPESTILCPMDSCSSFATTETFREFMNRPHILHLEMPLFFKISLGQCKGKRCSEEGFINMSFCNHSLCMTCLESCKSASICVGEDCTNAGIPPARYFDHLLSAIKDKMQTPFMVWGADFTLENWKCSACKYPALYEIICCCHKVCAKCMKEMKTGGRIPIAIGKCPVNGCNELYPIPSYRNPSCERKTNANVKGSTLGQSERVNTSVVKPEKTVSHSLKKSRGLQNIAFSCYRNSILQILAETPGFYECLERICDKESNSWTNPLAEILHRIRSRNTADVEMFSILNSFHYQFNNTNIGFREYQQEDTLSFLMTLLNGLNDHYEKSKKNVDGFKNALDIFKGKFEDKYFCENCKKEESFNQSDFLSLPLLKKSSLFESFSYLFEEEAIDMFPCSRCESRTLKKQLQICSFPDVLVLQLNREGNVYWTRDDDKTDFKEFLKDAWNEELSQKVSLNEIKSYRLYGVVVHRGDEKGGHYICFVRRRDESSWEECDDSVVTAANIKRVLRANAYLLFYEKCDSEV